MTSPRILVTGVGGFIGANLARRFTAAGLSVRGVSRSASWRSAALADCDVVSLDLSDDAALAAMLDSWNPDVIINCAAHGAYPNQTDFGRMMAVNVELPRRLAEWCIGARAALVHMGSSSEYGSNSDGPSEGAVARPNSEYAATKLLATNLLAHYVETKGLRATTLRLYSIYGPLEEPTRLVPTLIRKGDAGTMPKLSSPEVSRDFVHVDDVVALVERCITRLGNGPLPPVINVGTGTRTTMRDVAAASKAVFSIADEPEFVGNLRAWDLERWVANTDLVGSLFPDWHPRGFIDGLRDTAQWYAAAEHRGFLELGSAPQGSAVQRRKVSAIIACYRDEPAIPIMYERLVKACEAADVDHEIIFVNDGSPDDSLAAIERLSARDANVIGITHSRNFGSQSAFLSGMSLASGDACVLLDGDLQDPPELIVDFVREWRNGADVVFGRRIKREATWFMQLAYKTFYRMFARFSPFKVPRDAGDFSLMSRHVVDHIVAMPERELFLRAARAYVGFKQVGVDYVRPERMFGRSTNSLLRNVGWAVRGFIAVSRAPLVFLTWIGLSLFSLSILALVAQVVVKLVNPDSAPPGVISLLTVTTFFGSVNVLALSVLGAYIGRLMDEVRQRPRFITRFVTRNGHSRPDHHRG
jgi:nucleoside-diphosphate-sugar epimerase/glycosyltransferase involved in cell wall biosynthesis